MSQLFELFSVFQSFLDTEPAANIRWSLPIIIDHNINPYKY